MSPTEGPGRRGIETYRRAARYVVVTGAELPGSAGRLADMDAVIDRTVARLDVGAGAPGCADPRAHVEHPGAALDDAVRSRLPPELERLIRDGVPIGQRSQQFHRVVQWLKDLDYTVDQIDRVLTRHPGGIGAKYVGRLTAEVERCYAKPSGQSGGTHRQHGANEASPLRSSGTARPTRTPSPGGWSST